MAKLCSAWRFQGIYRNERLESWILDDANGDLSVGQLLELQSHLEAWNTRSQHEQFGRHGSRRKFPQGLTFADSARLVAPSIPCLIRD